MNNATVRIETNSNSLEGPVQSLINPDRSSHPLRNERDVLFNFAISSYSLVIVRRWMNGRKWSGSLIGAILSVKWPPTCVLDH